MVRAADPVLHVPEPAQLGLVREREALQQHHVVVCREVLLVGQLGEPDLLRRDLQSLDP